MRVECPACGQRLEMVGHVVNCPNCGQPVKVAFEPPLTRSAKLPAIEELEVVAEPAPPATYAPPKPERRLPPWLPATLAVVGVFFGLVAVLYVASVKLAQYAMQPAPPPPAPAIVPPTPPPPTTDQTKGSTLFSFNTQSDAKPQATGEPVSPAPAVPPAPVTQPTPTAPPKIKVTVAAAPVTEIVTDAAIQKVLVKGVDYLIRQFDEQHRLKRADDQQAGAHALCTLALIHAGQAINDERLNIHSPFMIGILEQLKSFTVPTGNATYTRSLRAQALAMYNRREDRAALSADARWLINNSVKGAYGYQEPPTGTTQPTQFGWDNSNAQYGSLGAWAADEAGIAISDAYWLDVQKHWEQCQTASGGWSYSAGNAAPSLSMSVAGVNMLFVANEMISSRRPDEQVARPPFSPSLQKGLDWLATGDNGVNLSNSPFYGYTLYGIERAGLASGFKMFGKHDWFRTLAKPVIEQYGKEGAWPAGDIDTAFILLFLSRGRHPLMMNKLHYVGPWANRPRDVARLAKFVTTETERPLNWQVVSLSSDWGDWMDSPILYIAGHEAPIFDENDYAKLTAFVKAGGLIFTQADGGSREFTQWAELLANTIFKQDLKDVPPDHFLYTALFRPKEKFPIRAISNGTRLLMVHCDSDIAKRWQSKKPTDDRSAFELGANLFVYATGMDVPRNRVDSLFVPEVADKPTATIPIARLKHAGDWDPEPYAWTRESRLFRRETSIAIEPTPVEIEKLSLETAPFAHLTTTAALSLSDAEIAKLRTYIDAGGVLLVDACGGQPATRQSVREIAARVVPDKTPADMRTDHPVLAGKGDGLTQIANPQVRPFVFKALGQRFPKIQLIESGKGGIILSELDITSGLLGNKTLGIIGFEPEYAHALTRNLILWTINGRE